MITFRPLLETLENRNIDYSTAARVYGLDTDIFFAPDDVELALDEINRLCENLDCEVYEIMEYRED